MLNACLDKVAVLPVASFKSKCISESIIDSDFFICISGSAVVLVELQTFAIYRVLLDRYGAVTSIAWLRGASNSRDLKAPRQWRLAYGDVHGEVVVWDVESGTVISRLSTTFKLREVVPYASHMMAVGDGSKKAHEHESQAMSVKGLQWVLPGPRLLAVLFSSSLLILWDAKNGGNIVWKHEIQTPEGSQVTGLLGDPSNCRRLCVLCTLGYFFIIELNDPYSSDVALNQYHVENHSAAGDNLAGKSHRDPHTHIASAASMSAKFLPYKDMLLLLLPRQIVIFDLELGIPAAVQTLSGGPRQPPFSSIMSVLGTGVCNGGGDEGGCDHLHCLHSDGSMSVWMRNAGQLNFKRLYTARLTPPSSRGSNPPVALVAAAALHLRTGFHSINQDIDDNDSSDSSAGVMESDLFGELHGSVTAALLPDRAVDHGSSSSSSYPSRPVSAKSPVRHFERSLPQVSIQGDEQHISVLPAKCTEGGKIKQRAKDSKQNDRDFALMLFVTVTADGKIWKWTISTPNPVPKSYLSGPTTELPLYSTLLGEILNMKHDDDDDGILHEAAVRTPERPLPELHGLLHTLGHAAVSHSMLHALLPQYSPATELPNSCKAPSQAVIMVGAAVTVAGTIEIISTHIGAGMPLHMSLSTSLAVHQSAVKGMRWILCVEGLQHLSRQGGIFPHVPDSPRLITYTSEKCTIGQNVVPHSGSSLSSASSSSAHHSIHKQKQGAGAALIMAAVNSSVASVVSGGTTTTSQGYKNVIAITDIESRTSTYIRDSPMDVAPLVGIRTSPSGCYLLLLFSGAPSELWTVWGEMPLRLRLLDLPFSAVEWMLPELVHPSFPGGSTKSVLSKPAPAITIKASESVDAAASTSAAPPSWIEMLPEERVAFTLHDGRTGVLNVQGRKVQDAKASRPQLQADQSPIEVKATALFAWDHLVVMGDEGGNLLVWNVESGDASVLSTGYVESGDASVLPTGYVESGDASVLPTGYVESGDASVLPTGYVESGDASVLPTGYVESGDASVLPTGYVESGDASVLPTGYVESGDALSFPLDASVLPTGYVESGDTSVLPTGYVESGDTSVLPTGYVESGDTSVLPTGYVESGDTSVLPTGCGAVRKLAVGASPHPGLYSPASITVCARIAALFEGGEFGVYELDECYRLFKGEASVSACLNMGRILDLSWMPLPRCYGGSAMLSVVLEGGAIAVVDVVQSVERKCTAKDRTKRMRRVLEQGLPTEVEQPETHPNVHVQGCKLSKVTPFASALHLPQSYILLMRLLIQVRISPELMKQLEEYANEQRAFKQEGHQNSGEEAHLKSLLQEELLSLLPPSTHRQVQACVNMLLEEPQGSATCNVPCLPCSAEEAGTSGAEKQLPIMIPSPAGTGLLHLPAGGAEGMGTISAQPMLTEGVSSLMKAMSNAFKLIQAEPVEESKAPEETLRIPQATDPQRVYQGISSLEDSLEMCNKDLLQVLSELAMMRAISTNHDTTQPGCLLLPHEASQYNMALREDCICRRMEVAALLGRDVEEMSFWRHLPATLLGLGGANQSLVSQQQRLLVPGQQNQDERWMPTLPQASGKVQDAPARSSTGKPVPVVKSDQSKLMPKGSSTTEHPSSSRSSEGMSPSIHPFNATDRGVLQVPLITMLF
ncbi:hypothetical protein CEUSTIGMA_g9407.t1 [Chlamydomonas eustigma]|uniref:Uncharacterized protein n=1 Tax=Chlamydomonas eustigma TaxID=1157962 RepID=A0A250XGE3_9CHLO|nr:hypothetical protein CEUSTIGMA_g9407.t1 [Chlamydomonas eustigma]|eukprot:GAX81979.1 hypothetical protein CEUSTIGMA_g9407.t1 [Chlamydomonas eustigma]